MKNQHINERRTPVIIVDKFMCCFCDFIFYVESNKSYKAKMCPYCSSRDIGNFGSVTFYCYRINNEYQEGEK